MINRAAVIILSYIFILFFRAISSAQTTIAITTMPAYTGTIDEEAAAAKFEKFPNLLFDTNKDVIPTALAMINTIGYPNGRAMIMPLPHLEFGTAVGGGVLQYKRQKDYTAENPTFPFGGVNGGFHIGTGIISGVDVTLKAFLFSYEALADSTQKMEGKGNSAYIIEIEDADLNSYGIKFRYNFVERRVILPLIFSFGGMTINLAGDYLHGRMKSNFQVTDNQAIDYNGNPANVQLDVSGVPDIEFNIYSVTPEAFIYFDFFTLLSLYTGPSISFNFGEFDFNLDARGTLVNTQLGTEGEQIATAHLVSKYTMEPKLFLPKWTVGLEFSLLALKIQVEGSTLLTSASDSFTGQAGIRFQF